MAKGGVPTIRLAMAILDCNAAWRTIEAHQPARLTELFASDADRVGRLSRDVASIHFDFSKTHLDEGLIEAFAVQSRIAMGSLIVGKPAFAIPA